MCDLDPKIKVIGKKAGICDSVPSTAALVKIFVLSVFEWPLKTGFTVSTIFLLLDKNEPYLNYCLLSHLLMIFRTLYCQRYGLRSGCYFRTCLTESIVFVLKFISFHSGSCFILI